MNRIVIDTSVFMDMMVSSRPRFEIGNKLLKILHKNEYTLVQPAHVVFEMISACRQEKGSNAKPLPSNPRLRDIPLALDIIKIDKKFINRCIDLGIVIGLKAGDMIFMYVAMLEKIPLITEDCDMYREAKRRGIEVYKIDEFLSKHQV